jgi:hypothetical protein
MSQNSPQKTTRPLTPRQEKFIGEYLSCGNATLACVKAGYSSKWAHKFAPQLLGKNRRIREEVQKRQEEMKDTLHLSATRIVEELSAIGMSNILDVVKQNPNGSIEINDLNAMPAHIRSSIASIECRETGSGRSWQRHTKVVLWNKISALDSLSKMLGINKETLDEELKQWEPVPPVKKFDPRTLDDEGWEAYKIVRAKMIEQAKL